MKIIHTMCCDAGISMKELALQHLQLYFDITKPLNDSNSDNEKAVKRPKENYGGLIESRISQI
jgi:hypothetical protein